MKLKELACGNLVKLGLFHLTVGLVCSSHSLLLDKMGFGEVSSCQHGSLQSVEKEASKALFENL